MKCFPIIKSLRKTIFIATFSLMILLLSGCGKQIINVTGTDVAMGTIIQQSLFLQGNVNQEEQKRLTDGVMNEMNRLDQEVLSWRLDSAMVWRLNEGAGQKEGTELTEELLPIMEKIWTVSRKSSGALDVTIGDVVQLWKIDEWVNNNKEIQGETSVQLFQEEISKVMESELASQFTIPTKEVIQEALNYTGYEKVTFQGNRIFLPEQMKLDLGAVGKGIACEKAAEYLESREEVTGAVISVGGSIVTLGKKTDGTPWKVGVVHPRKDGEYLGVLNLYGKWFISTSGDYERYAMVNGVRYHHIIDPEDGHPADSGIVSVTILCKDGLLSDALSTACFVMGAEEGIVLAEDMGAEALIVDEQGKLHMTKNMKSYLQAP